MNRLIDIRCTQIQRPINRYWTIIVCPINRTCIFRQILKWDKHSVTLLKSVQSIYSDFVGFRIQLIYLGICPQWTGTLRIIPEIKKYSIVLLVFAHIKIQQIKPQIKPRYTILIDQIGTNRYPCSHSLRRSRELQT